MNAYAMLREWSVQHGKVRSTGLDLHTGLDTPAGCVCNHGNHLPLHHYLPDNFMVLFQQLNLPRISKQLVLAWSVIASATFIAGDIPLGLVLGWLCLGWNLEEMKS